MEARPPRFPDDLAGMTYPSIWMRARRASSGFEKKMMPCCCLELLRGAGVSLISVIHVCDLVTQSHRVHVSPCPRVPTYYLKLEVEEAPPPDPGPLRTMKERRILSRTVIGLEESNNRRPTDLTMFFGFC